MTTLVLSSRTLKQLIVNRYSLLEVQHLKQCGEISDKIYKHYCFLWLWSAWRHDYRHSRIYENMGSEFYWKRIDKVKAMVARIVE